MKMLTQELDSYLKDCDFSGVISISNPKEITYQKGFGFQHLTHQVPNNPDTKFGIASGTKTFTALGMGILIDQGKVALNTAVSDIDPEFQGFIDPSATILDLLTHQSGMFDFYDEEIIEDFDNFFVDIPWYHLASPNDYMPLFVDRAMKFKPGERFAYSNGGYVFLSILIERIAKVSFFDFIDAHILQPAGMTHSGFFATNDLPPNTALGYLADHRTTNIFNLPIRGSGDGGMYTNAQDLQRFWAAFTSGQLLSTELTDVFTRTYHQFNEHYGYGCGVYKRLDNSKFSISGSDAGVGFSSSYSSKSGLVISILSNRTDGELDIESKIEELLNST